MCLLTSEARNAAVLDSGCSSNVAGKQWIKCFIDSLSEDKISQINEYRGHKIFKFGGGESKKSLGVIEFPCELAGKEVFIKCNIVDCDLPLLLSKEAMKKACVKLDLENDKAEIFGKEIDIDCTTSGHYIVSLQNVNVLLTKSHIPDEKN